MIYSSSFSKLSKSPVLIIKLLHLELMIAQFHSSASQSYCGGSLGISFPDAGGFTNFYAGATVFGGLAGACFTGIVLLAGFCAGG